MKKYELPNKLDAIIGSLSNIDKIMDKACEKLDLLAEDIKMEQAQREAPEVPAGLSALEHHARLQNVGISGFFQGESLLSQQRGQSAFGSLLGLDSSLVGRP